MMPRPKIANILELPTRVAAIAACVRVESSLDSSVIELFRAGDRDAFTAVYRAHHAEVFRFAFHMTADPASASEITQDAFVWLIHHASEFDPQRGALPAFLKGVARKLLQRRQRSERRWLPFSEVTAFSTGADFTRGIDAASQSHRACDPFSNSSSSSAAVPGLGVESALPRRLPSFEGVFWVYHRCSIPSKTRDNETGTRYGDNIHDGRRAVRRVAL
jgi:hypothetical protein